MDARIILRMLVALSAMAIVLPPVSSFAQVESSPAQAETYEGAREGGDPRARRQDDPGARREDDPGARRKDDPGARREDDGESTRNERRPDQNLGRKAVEVDGLNPENAKFENILQPRLAGGLYSERDVPEGQHHILRQFGYDRLLPGPHGLNPASNPGLLKDYRLAPGDQLMIHDSLATEKSPASVEVGPDGMLRIQGVEAIPAAGLTFDQLNETLLSNTKFIQVFPGSIRPVQVSLAGEAQGAGIHQVPAFASPVDVLALTGGVKKTGSLRRIQWLRAGKVIANIDLYDYLLNGSVPAAAQLQSGDVIFVPIVENLVAVAGQVKRPGIFEFGDDGSLKKVLELAGGILTSGDQNRILVERLDPLRGRVQKRLALDSGAPDDSTIQDMDIVKVYPLPETNRQFFTLDGDFERKGAFEWIPGITLREALLMGGRTTLGTSGIISRKRYSGASPYPLEESIAFNYQDTINGKNLHDFPILEGDQISIDQKDFGSRSMVTIQGDVIQSPGEQPFRLKMTVKDLILLSGGLYSYGLDPLVRVKSWDLVDGEYVRNDITLKIDANTLETEPNYFLMPGDTVFVREAKSFRKRGTVTIAGEVNFPGAYEFREGDRLSDLVKLAGGLSEKAFLDGIVYSRTSLAPLEKVVGARIRKDIDNSLLRSTVESSSSLTDAETQLKSVAAIRSSLQDNIDAEKAQNIELEKADEPGAQEEEEQQEEKKKIENLENRQKRSAIQGGDIGRISINLKNGKDFAGSQDDLVLVDGDSILVPPIPQTILVSGETYNEGFLLPKEDATVHYYLSVMGGERKLADIDSLYVVRPNGTIINTGLDEYVVRKGDTIVVPPDLTPKENSVKNTAVIVDVIFKTLTALALVVVLL